jgi:hypothetical protein
MAGSGFCPDTGDRGEIDFGMDGKVFYRQGNQVDIPVVPEMMGVFPKQPQQADRKAQEAARDGLEIKALRAVGGEAVQQVRWISGGIECFYRSLLDVDVVGVAVASNRIKRNHHLGFDLADQTGYKIINDGGDVRRSTIWESSVIDFMETAFPQEAPWEISAGSG